MGPLTELMLDPNVIATMVVMKFLVGALLFIAPIAIWSYTASTAKNTLKQLKLLERIEQRIEAAQASKK